MRDLRVAWADQAERELRDITPWEDAAWISAEIDRYAASGIGDVRRVQARSGQIVPTLFLPGYRVVFAYDRRARTLWVLTVYRVPTGG